MAKEEEDPGEQVFVAVVAFVGLTAVIAGLIYSGTIRDWLTGLLAACGFVVYVVVSTLLGPWIVKSGPTKPQSTYDAIGNPRRKEKTSPLAYLFVFIMPGYFIGKSVLWLWGLAFGGGAK